MKLALWSTLLFLLSCADFSAASDTSKTSKPLRPCTARSPTTERYFDLNPIHRKLPAKDDKRRKEDDVVESWHARGWDYGANFTINFCGPVVEDLNNVQDLNEDLWRNVSAYYEIGDKQYALG
jgi:cation-dependent mannose-6-phosphate receptor